MIKNGSMGSVTFYYKGLLISSFPLTKKKTLDAYLYHGEHLIYQSKGKNILYQIKVYTQLCNKIYRKKKNKEKISTDYHIYFLYCISALMRLKVIENDEANGYLLMPRKKPSKFKTSILKN
jgi:hypothetical protein